MDSLFILIPVAVIFSGIAVSLFIWAVNHRQFDDLDKESQRILFDDKSERRKPE
ncbi:MAG: cbb3-type cytochrome oxidase assembly protein CcoS [Spongiibacteraceae bacterium]